MLKVLPFQLQYDLIYSNFVAAPEKAANLSSMGSSHHSQNNSTQNLQLNLLPPFLDALHKFDKVVGQKVQKAKLRKRRGRKTSREPVHFVRFQRLKRETKDDCTESKEGEDKKEFASMERVLSASKSVEESEELKNKQGGKANNGT